MANIQIPLPDSFQEDFKSMLTNVARQAIETAREQDASYYGKDWLKQKEAMEWLNISYGTLQLWRSKGLKISTVAGITLISKDEINRFLIEHQQ